MQHLISYYSVPCISISILNFRHAQASMHFNENLHREPRKKADGSLYVQLTFPKFKGGTEVVRNVSSQPTYSKYNASVHTVGFLILYQIPNTKLTKYQILKVILRFSTMLKEQRKIEY